MRAHATAPVGDLPYDPAMPWVRRRYRGNKVYVELDDAGALVLGARGLAKMRYKPEDERTYSVRPAELSEIAASEASRSDAGPAASPEAAPGSAPAAPRRPRKKAASKSAAKPVAPPARKADAPPSPADAASDGPGDDVPALAGLAVHAYTDGASLGNPGPAGAGVVLLFREHRKEASIYLGETTNNVAELTAVLEALKLIRRRELPVRLHSDSTYVIGVLDGSYRAKANLELVAAIRAQMQEFADLRLVKVEAHVGIEWNERADALAGKAAREKRSHIATV